MELDYNPEGVAAYVRSDEYEREVQRRLDVAEDYWATNARVDTGRMRRATRTAVMPEANGELVGVFEADTEQFGAWRTNYTPYQEFGTSHISAMGLLADIIHIIEAS